MQGLPPCSFLPLRASMTRRFGTGFTNLSQHLCPRAGMIKIEVGRIDKGGFEDEDTAENIGCSLCFGVVPSGGSAGVPV
ncbi:hypothetical protein I5750_016925 [Clostridioides difficile]